MGERSLEVFKKYTAGVSSMTRPIIKGTIDPNKEYLLVHTNICVKFYQNIFFWWDSSKAITELKNYMPDKCVGMTVSVKPLKANWETVTVWTDIKDMKKFYTTGVHLDIMKRWSGHFKRNETSETLRYKIKGDLLTNVNSYEETKAFFNLVKTGNLQLWENK